MVDDRVQQQTLVLQTRHSHHVLVDEVSLTLLLPLGESDVYWLGSDDAAVHFSDGFSGVLWRRKANEPEASAASTCFHHLGREILLDFSAYFIVFGIKDVFLYLTTGDGPV